MCQLLDNLAKNVDRLDERVDDAHSVKLVIGRQRLRQEALQLWQELHELDLVWRDLHLVE